MAAPRSTHRFFALSAMVLALLGALACDRGAGFEILDVHTSRAPDGRVVADIAIEGVEQGGGDVGPYCVSVHWFNFGFGSQTEPTIVYAGAIDKVEQCDADLSDGDLRTYRLISNRTDLAPGQPARVQVRFARSITTKQAVFAP